MSREYDFGEGGKVALTGRTNEHQDMFRALQTLGATGARIARYINDLKGQVSRREEAIAKLKEIQPVDDDHARQTAVHQGRFPMARPVIEAPLPKAKRERVFSDTHTPGPWRMARTGMVRAGADWICAVTARNRIHNGPLIEVAPEMLAMLERMLAPVAPSEAQQIIADARDLVRRAKAPGWVQVPRIHDEAI